MESQMKYSKVLTTLGLVITVVLAGELLNPKISLAQTYTTQIKNRFTGKCLDAEANSGGNGTIVQVWDCTGFSNQKWIRNPRDFTIRSLRFQSKCLDADVFNRGNGTRVQLWDCTNTPQQRWKLVYTGSSQYYRLRNEVLPQRDLDAERYNRNNGARVQLWQFTSGYTNQHWDFVP